MIVNLWVTSPERLLEFQLAETEVDRFRAMFLDPNLDNDMTDYGWIRVGEAEISIQLTASKEELTSTALQHIASAEAELLAMHQRKLAALKELRGKLTALPHKKESDNA